MVAIYWTQMAMMGRGSLWEDPEGMQFSNITSHTQQQSLSFSPSFQDEIQT